MHLYAPFASAANMASCEIPLSSPGSCDEYDGNDDMTPFQQDWIEGTYDFTLQSGKILKILESKTLTINSGKTLTNNGIILDYGTIQGTGTLKNNQTAVTNFLSVSDVKDDINLEHDFTLLSSKILNIHEGKTLTINSDKTLINNGIVIDYGIFTVNGIFTNNQTAVTNILDVIEVKDHVNLEYDFTLSSVHRALKFS